MITKHLSDVTINMSLKHLPLGNSVASAVILTKGDSDAVSSKLYYDLDDVSADFAEDTIAYLKAETMFAQDGFNGPVEIIKTKNVESVEVSSTVQIGDVTAKATKDGATVTAQTKTVKETVSSYVEALMNYLWEGWRYVVLDTSDTKIIQEVGQYLYENQHGILVAQIDNIADLSTIHDALTKETKVDHLGTTYVLVHNNEGEHVDAAAVAFASLHIPLNWMHIRDLNGITAGKWAYDEIQQINTLGGSAVVNKAGNLMLSNPKMVDESFVDNSFGYQFVYDELQNGLQKYLNSQDIVKYDDDGISLLKAQTEEIMNNIAKMGVLANGLDGKPIFNVIAVSRSNTPNSDVIKRVYRGLTVNCELVHSIQNVKMEVNVTL